MRQLLSLLLTISQIVCPIRYKPILNPKFLIVIVSNLFYSYLSKEHGVAEVAAKKAYHSIDIAIAHYAIFIHGCKKAASRARANVAHPPVSQTDLDNFLDDQLGGNREDLSPLQVKLFDFLRATSISPSNIQGARTSR